MTRSKGKATNRPRHEAGNGYVACKPMSIDRTWYERGDRVDVSRLTQAKLDQLVDHRILAAATTEV